MCFQVPSDSKCSMIFHWPIFWLSTHPKNERGDQEEEEYTLPWKLWSSCVLLILYIFS